MGRGRPRWIRRKPERPPRSHGKPDHGRERRSAKLLRDRGRNVGGPGVNRIQTDLFSVSGKLSQLRVAPNVQSGAFNEIQRVALTANDPDATIIFTTDGTDPSVGGAQAENTGQTSTLMATNSFGSGIANGTEYTGPITISEDTELRFIAVNEANTSKVFSQNYKIDTKAPTVGADPEGGTFENDGPSVSLTADEAADIHYTTDGSEPTTESDKFDSRNPIKLSETATLKFFAVDRVGNRSEVATEEYEVIDAIAPSASASLNAGTFDAARQVSLSTNDPSASIHFTINGSEPTTTSPRYSVPLTVSKTTTLKFFAVDPSGNRSETITRTYVIRTASAVALNVSKANLKLGQSRVISGRVVPAHDSSVKVTIKRNGKRVLSRNLKLKDSRFTLRYKPRAVGVYSVRIAFAGDADHKPNAAAKSFRVVRR